MTPQARNQHGQFTQEVDDDEIAAYVHRQGRVATHEITSRFEHPRTTVWTALGRLEARDEVQRRSLGSGRSAMWEPGPPYTLCGPEFQALRPDGVTISDVSAHLSSQVDGDTPSPATISRFENGETRIQDPMIRRTLYQYYTREASDE